MVSIAAIVLLYFKLTGFYWGQNMTVNDQKRGKVVLLNIFQLKYV